jgi:hypothetical protein
MTRTLLLAAAFGLVASGAAYASETCSVPKAEWQPEQALRQKLETAGWKITRIKIDDGCYEVYGTDANGKQAETYFDPKSLEPVELNSAKVEEEDDSAEAEDDE